MNIQIGEVRRDSQAWCPKCEEQVHCCQLEYVRLYNTHNMTMWHPECDTTWKIEL